MTKKQKIWLLVVISQLCAVISAWLASHTFHNPFNGNFWHALFLIQVFNLEMLTFAISGILDPENCGLAAIFSLPKRS